MRNNFVEMRMGSATRCPMTLELSPPPFPRNFRRPLVLGCIHPDLLPPNTFLSSVKCQSPFFSIKISIVSARILRSKASFSQVFKLRIYQNITQNILQIFRNRRNFVIVQISIAPPRQPQRIVRMYMQFRLLVRTVVLGAVVASSRLPWSVASLCFPLPRVAQGQT